MIELHTSHTQDRENGQFLLIEISMLKEKNKVPFNVQTCTPYKRFSMIELIAPYIFQSPFLSFVFSGISKVLFIYLRSLPLITTHTERKLNFLKKQTIGHKRSMEYKVKDQDILLTYERLICRLTFGTRQKFSITF